MNCINSPISGYEEMYSITTCGVVTSHDRQTRRKKVKGQVLKARNNGSGYLFVCLCKDGKCERYYIHRLVAQTFLQNPESKCCVNHKDGNPSNNHLPNLEWVSHSENMRHALDNNLTSNKGGTHYMAVGVIDNELGMKFGTVKEWCAARKISYSTGANVLAGVNKSRIIDLSAIVLLKKNRRKDDI